MIYLLKNKNYQLVFWGRVVSFLGDRLQDICLMWYILTLTQSPLLASISLIINFMPGIIFSPIAGTLADRYNRKTIMVLCDYLNGILAIILGTLIFFKFNIYYLFVTTFIMSSLDTLFKPASTAIIPQVVKKEALISANSLSEASANLINIIGPILAGILFALYNPVYLFLANGVSFILSATMELFITLSSQQESDVEEATKQPESTKSIFSLKQFIHGFRVVINNRFLFFTAIIGGSVTNLFLAPLALYIPVYIKDVLKLSSTYYGIMTAAIAIGGLAGSIILLLVGSKLNKRTVVIYTFFLQGFSLILFGMIQNLIASFIALVILGMTISIIGVCLNTIIQEQIPAEILGSCISTLMIIASVAIPVGYFAGGFVIQVISLGKVLTFSGAVITLCGLCVTMILKGTISKNVEDVDANLI